MSEHSHTHTHVDENGHVYEHSHGHHHSHAQTKAVLNRLSRAQGHLDAVRKMVERGEDCAEVLVQLIEFIKVQNGCSLLDAVREALKQVVGAYAMAVIDRNEPAQIIAARKSSPLGSRITKEVLACMMLGLA